MKTKKINNFFPVCIACLSVLLVLSCKPKVNEGTLIITLSPANQGTLDFTTGKGWRYIPGSQIAAVDPGKSSSGTVLTKDFYSACSPDVSWDGEHMLFAGQKREHDAWQIWEMDLKKNKFRVITDSLHNCTDPVYLPLDRFVYSEEQSDDSLGTRHSLFTAQISGTDIKQITFAPQTNFATIVLKDGRLLTITQQVLPEKKDPLYMVLRHDGTKSDPFYKGKSGSVLLNRSREASDGKIYFVEMDTLKKRGDIVSVSYSRPYGSKEIHTAKASGNFKAVFPGTSDKLWVSYTEDAQNQPFALYEFDGVKEKLGKCIYAKEKMNVVDVLEVRKHNRPQKLPSEVDMGVKTGLLLCLDINYSEQQILHPSADYRKADRIEVLGADTSYGIIQAEKDGSLYLKVMADVPFRIQTLDENSRVVLGPGDWMWLRPNERRGVVSFYSNPELAPENVVPQAVKKAPVIIPVIVTEVQEKEVELE
jgi:hypothetical protein